MSVSLKVDIVSMIPIILIPFCNSYGEKDNHNQDYGLGISSISSK